MATDDDLTVNHPVVSHEEWLAARRALLEKEKAFTRQCDEMSRLQRSLPWERVTKEYAFEGAEGRATLGGLFAGCSQLIVYHFMFHPDDRAAARIARYAPLNLHYHYLDLVPKGRDEAGRGPYWVRRRDEYGK